MSAAGAVYMTRDAIDQQVMLEDGHWKHQWSARALRQITDSLNRLQKVSG